MWQLTIYLDTHAYNAVNELRRLIVGQVRRDCRTPLEIRVVAGVDVGPKLAVVGRRVCLGLFNSGIDFGLDLLVQLLLTCIGVVVDAGLCLYLEFCLGCPGSLDELLLDALDGVLG